VPSLSPSLDPALPKIKNKKIKSLAKTCNENDKAKNFFILWGVKFVQKSIYARTYEAGCTSRGGSKLNVFLPNIIRTNIVFFFEKKQKK
jgi:hypothetical protein